ncbi:hypothetical protein ACFSE0_10685 [Ochrobactrum teleogrylli]|uniref:Uncharacterized protein n=1 Tax=Ochrobactrum teleogrylli TaxID=2479765 RepID=A0ABY2Y8T2_9HYPH|nr:hypothetical protein [[Ochrobactrum] teleogrylli]TNV17761.1 hypothetical protein FIC94_06190 [[Ochrobactrum] teleogrylli]
MFVSKQTCQLFDNQANVVAIYPLQGLATENVPDWLEEFTNDLGYTDRIHPIFDALPALRKLCSGPHWPTPEQFLDALQFGNEKGFIFYGDWEPRDYLDDSTFVSGPGRRRIIWVYADTIEAGFDAVINAAKADHARQKANAGAA